MINHIHHIFLIIISIQLSLGQIVSIPPSEDDTFVGDCTCPDPYDLPICCDPSLGTTTSEDPSEYLVDYANPCLAECNGIQPPAQESPHCRVGTTCEELINGGTILLTPQQPETGEPPLLNPPTNVAPTEFIDNCQCTDFVISPVCCIVNADGMKENYDNTCLAACNGITYPYFDTQGGACQLGTCESLHPCGCPPDYDPICCNDDQDFLTICDAECPEIGGIVDPPSVCVSGKCVVDEIGGNTACVQICDGYNVEGTGQEICCDEDKDFMSDCYAVCDGYDVNTQCVDGFCQPPVMGIFSIGTPQEFTMLNMITIGIQLFILAICCLGIGCAIPSLVEQGKWGFEFKGIKTMPNFDFKMKMPRKEVSYGPDL